MNKSNYTSFSQTRVFLVEDFENDIKCGRVDDQIIYAPDYSSLNCKSNLLSEFEAWEEEIFDTLYACCTDRFPNSITSCCETTGEGGCPLSGIVQWLPDWDNDHCYEKDTNLIEEWEWRWAHKTLEACCGRCETAQLHTSSPSFALFNIFFT